MVVQTQALLSVAELKVTKKAQRQVGRRGWVFVGPILVVETAWLLTLTWVGYDLMF